MNLDVSGWKIADVLGALRSRQVSAREICAAAFARIAEENPKNNGFLTLMEEQAGGRAAEIDRILATGQDLPPLAGVPAARKDVNLC